MYDFTTSIPQIIEYTKIKKRKQKIITNKEQKDLDEWLTNAPEQPPEEQKITRWWWEEKDEELEENNKI